MNKFLNIIILLIIVTGLVCLTKPQLHRQMMIVGSEYVFVDEESLEQIKEKVEPQLKQIQKNGFSKNQQKIQQTGKQTAQRKTAQKTVRSAKKIEKQNEIKPTQIKQTKQNEIKEIKKDEPKKVEEKPINEEKNVEPPSLKKENPEQKAEPIVSQIKELTEEEEIIAWNKWRSDLQNQVMKDTNISAPIGVIFKFSFTVDKFGNMSNIKVWSQTAGYSDIAVNAIKPVLMSYQRQPILTFPQGTKRVITNVAGGFVMAETTGYSSPSDYSDYERIKR